MVTSLPLFDGKTFHPDRDGQRLLSQLDAVRHILSDNRWHILTDIQKDLRKLGIEASEAGISARIRDLRKAKFGLYIVERRYLEDGLWAYRMGVA